MSDSVCIHGNKHANSEVNRVAELIVKHWPHVMVNNRVLHKSSELYPEGGFHAKWSKESGLVCAIKQIQAVEEIETISGTFINVTLYSGPKEG